MSEAAFIVEMQRPDGTFAQLCGVSLDMAREKAVDGVYECKIMPTLRVRVLVESGPPMPR